MSVQLGAGVIHGNILVLVRALRAAYDLALRVRSGVPACTLVSAHDRARQRRKPRERAEHPSETATIVAAHAWCHSTLTESR